MDIPWFYLSDITCLVHGGPSAQAVYDLTASLLKDEPPSDGRSRISPEDKLQALFGPDSRARRSLRPGTEPELAHHVRRVVAENDPDRPDRLRWKADALGGFDLRFVWMPNGKEREALLTPDALYLCRATFEKHYKRVDLGGVDSPGTDMVKRALRNDHVWLEAVMPAADALAKHFPESLGHETDEARATIDAMAAAARLVTRDAGADVKRRDPFRDLEPVETGTFAVKPDPGLPRNRSRFHVGDGRLVFHLGTGTNKDVDPLYARWQCGGFGRRSAAAE